MGRGKGKEGGLGGVWRGKMVGRKEKDRGRGRKRGWGREGLGEGWRREGVGGG